MSCGCSLCRSVEWLRVWRVIAVVCEGGGLMLEKVLGARTRFRTLNALVVRFELRRVCRGKELRGVNILFYLICVPR